MLVGDMEQLMHFAGKYSLKEVLKTYAIICQAYADDCVDQDMNEKAKHWTILAKSMKKFIKDNKEDLDICI